MELFYENGANKSVTAIWSRLAIATVEKEMSELTGKEAAMRRFVVLVAALAILPSGLACHHLAGKCDCWQNSSLCCKYGLYQSDSATVIPAVGVRTEVAPPPAPQPGVQMQPITTFGSGM
jgi:hypothetical protein